MATQCPGTTCKTGDDAFISIIDGIRKKALSHPDSPALSFLPDGKAENAELCSYSRLDMRARAIAAAIQATGQGDGRPVLLMLPPGLEFIAAFFGCLYARAIAVPMTPPGLARMARTFNRLARIVEDSGSRVFITSARLRKAVEELAERVHFADSIRIICLDETDDALSRSWQELPLTAHTPGWLQYTSGSTSSPKGVIITHGNIMANLDSIAGHMRLRENIPTVSWLPPFHDMGLVGGILTPLHLGCLCVTMPPMAFLRQPLCWLRAVTHYRAQLTGGPNFAYDLCCDRIPEDRLRELDLSSLSVCYCGSEPIRLKTIRRFLERFSSAGLDPASFYPCYGLAENTLFTTGCWKNDGDFAVFLDKQEYAAGRIRFLQEQHADAMPLLSCGTAGRNNDVRIVDPQTCREVEEKELGEIWIRGTCVSPGYWEQPEATKTVLHAVLAGSGEGPFLRTGDMGFMSGGHLFVSGRCKEMIILNGRNFFPQDLEECVLQNVPGLEQNGAAAFGIDSDAGERL
ncbi:fatty acyl-AMP ligase, partial [Desulfovibrio sp.]|uniref:fatty acyl-AMP ligase n=1 Tax=Desulfovibrio sp. TaxID=885 RepID=UPI0030782BBC